MREILGIENLENWFFQRKNKFWKLFTEESTKSRQAIADNWSDVDNDYSIEDSWRSLRATIAQYGDSGIGAYLWVKDDIKSTNGGYYTLFKIPSYNSQIASSVSSIGNPSTGAPVGYIKEDELEKRLQDQMEKFHNKIKMEQLEKELEELKKQNKELTQEETAIDRAIGYLEPYFPDILGKIFPGTQAVSGTPKQPQNKEFPNETVIEKQEMTEDESAKVVQSLQTLETVIPNLPEVLEKLATMSKENPSKLQMALKFLK